MITLNKNQKIVLVTIGAVIVAIVGIYFWNQMDKEEYSMLDTVSNISNTMPILQEEVKEEIVIHITGAVNQQGIIRLAEGARIADAIEKAGGETQEADLTRINLAYVLEDGQKIYVPRKQDEEKITQEEYISSDSGNNVIVDTVEPKGGSSTMININTATQSELETLPGIGPSTAQKIMEHREQNGKFNSIEEIKNVKGIGDAKYESLKNNITVK